jgi:hypothetical protein
MAAAVQMSRSRGSLSGLALVVLGAWGGLAPLIEPYLHTGFQPNEPWHYSTGRLYLSILPGAVVLLAGLVILITKSRGLGGVAALFAALGGAWFAVGGALLLAAGVTGASLTVGAAIPGSVAQVVLLNLITFAGVGLLVVFFAALALGRMSLGAYKDFLRFGDQSAVVVGGLSNVGLGTSNSPFDNYQPAQHEPAQYEPAQYQPDVAGGQSYDTTTGQQPVVGGQAQFPSQYPNQETAGFPDTADVYGANTTNFSPGGPVTYSPGQTQYPPTQTSPTPEQYPPNRQ